MLMKKILMAQAGESGGGGAGGAGAAGGDGAGGGEVVFNEAQKAEMIRMQNAAVSAHHTRMQKAMDAKLEERDAKLEALNGTLTDLVAKLSSGNGAGGGNGKGKGGKGGGDDDAITTMRAEYEARIAEVEKRADQAERKRQEEHENAQRTEERAKLGGALRAAGINEGLLRSAQALLYSEDKRIGRSKEGAVVFKMQREGYVEDLDLAAGLEEWLKTPEGKHFAPTRDARGSGAESGRAGGAAGANGKKSVQEKKRDLVRAILQAEKSG